MTLYMPPLQRKKRVLNRYNPDSFRVISHDAESQHPKFNPKPDYRPPTPEREKSGVSLPDIYNRKTQVLPKDQPDYRANKPHPGSCGFLRHNVRVLNEPICSVFTADTHSEQGLWWPSRTSNDPLNTPPKTKDTTYRGDFMKDEYGRMHRTTRHESNTDRDPAHGTVPVNFLRNRDGTQKVFKETKSYEHDYNCRTETNYPIRGRRVGSFVYDEMSRDLTNRFIDQNSRLLDEVAAEERMKSAVNGASGDGQCKSTSSPKPSSPKQNSPAVDNTNSQPSALAMQESSEVAAISNGGNEIPASPTKQVTFDVTKSDISTK